MTSCPACGAPNEDDEGPCRACGATRAPQPTLVVTKLELRPGMLFHGRFEIEDVLGQGGMGIVYRARDRVLDEGVAIKVLRPDYAADEKMAERFKSEIKLARRVRHRNVCGIHDFGEAHGLLYISMELVLGTDLKKIVKQQGALPSARAALVMAQACAGLQAVHDAGIVHRDLKSANIMVESSGLVRLMDFGIAKQWDTVGGMTATGQIVGTPEYMSPEQARGGKADARSDLYSLAIVAYEVWTGHVPFRGDTPISTILKHIQEPPPFQAGELAEPVRRVLGRALAKDPAERFATATELGEALQNASEDLATASFPTTTRASSVVSPAAAAAGRPAARPRPAALDRTDRGPRRAIRAATAIVAVVAAMAALVLLWPRVATQPPTVVTASPPASVRPQLPPPTLRLQPVASSLPTSAPTASSLSVAVPAATPSATPRAPRSRASETAATPATQDGTGFLQLGVKPWAEVAIDGRIVGTTPLDRIPLPPGRHVVRLVHPAYPAVEREVVVAPGHTERLQLDLAER